MDLSDWIERRAGFTPDKTALRFEGAEISYQDFAARIARLAAALKTGLGPWKGIGRGDRVAYLGANTPEMLDLLFACARLGAILVPLNWRLAPPEHAYILGHAGADAIFVEPDFFDHMETIRGDIGECRLVAYGAAPDGWLGYDDLLAQAAGDLAAARNPHVSYDSPVLIVYTSGTTGRPRGAVLTQNAIFWNAVNATHMHDLTSADHVLTALPMFHVGGLNIQTLPALHAGGTVTLHRRFDPGAVLAAIAADRPTLIVLVPATIMALADHPDWAATDLSCLRMVTTGSSIVPLPVLATVHARDVPCIQVYGSTETAPIAIYLTRDDARRRAGSTGKPAVHCDIRVVDAAGRDAPAGTAGEILVRGPNVMFEYWGDAAATAEALRDGWFHSGDVGHVDEDGYYWIDERKTDLIVSGGENIYPAELEAVLDDCADIAEAAVVARPDDKWGEVPVAVVVRRDDSGIGPEDVLALFEGQLAHFKHPRDVIFVDALPRNVMGKVLKYELREMVG